MRSAFIFALALPTVPFRSIALSDTFTLTLLSVSDGSFLMDVSICFCSVVMLPPVAGLAPLCCILPASGAFVCGAELEGLAEVCELPARLPAVFCEALPWAASCALRKAMPGPEAELDFGGLAPSLPLIVRC